MKYKPLSFLVILLLLISCSGKKFKKNPVDSIIKNLTETKNFTILLYDMDVEGTFSKTYLHQYRILKQKADTTIDEEITQWYEVDKNFFVKHENDMGMEIASKKDGVVKKIVSPPGYSNYVGNSQYGHWVDRGGNSFWEFYGKYMFISSMFNMFSPVPRSYYTNYSSHYQNRMPYYGPSVGNTTYYGTGSTFNSKTKSYSRWNTNRANSSFKQRINNRVDRSSRTSSRLNSKSKTSRSGSRYSGRSSYRSRGGGFGK